MNDAIANDDERWMQRALALAREVEGLTSPNPPVGCVLVRNGEALAEGAHQGAGQPHAERIALRAAMEAGVDPAGATAYVTLEPCSTAGRTPACTEGLIENGITRVVYGSVDPNPKHAGRADSLLAERNIEVLGGVLSDQTEQLIAPFRKWILEGRPWVIAKAGASLDGRLTRPPGESNWITSPASRADAQATLRAKCDAILVGAATARIDDPSLTFRGDQPVDKTQPWRVVVTRSGDLPEDLRLLTDEFRERTLVYTGQPLDNVLADLASKGIVSVLAEGGGQLHRELFAGGHVDEVCFYLAPRIVGGGVPAVGGSAFPEDWNTAPLYDLQATTVGDDLRVTAKVRRTGPAVFFDRDGVVNVPVTEGGGYVLREDDFQLEPGAAEALRLVKAAGLPAILITNQKCVAKGLLSETGLAAIHARMQELLLAEVGEVFDAIYACIDDPTSPEARYKPSPAMFEEAARDHAIDLASSSMIGDQDRDLEGATAAGIPTTIRVRGETEPEFRATQLVESVADLPDALASVLRG